MQPEPAVTHTAERTTEPRVTPSWKGHTRITERTGLEGTLKATQFHPNTGRVPPPAQRPSNAALAPPAMGRPPPWAAAQVPLCPLSHGFPPDIQPTPRCQLRAVPPCPATIARHPALVPPPAASSPPALHAAARCPAAASSPADRAQLPHPVSIGEAHLRAFLRTRPNSSRPSRAERPRPARSAPDKDH